MAEQNNSSPAAVESPSIHHRSGPSLVWLIPFITALIGGWLIFKTVLEQGPVITVSFKTAEGIEAGTTRVKYKNVEVGVVESVQFADDFSLVNLTIQMDKHAQPFLKRSTRFWVVRPRLSLREVSGLGTLLSGSYIEIEPGKGAAQTHYVGMEAPPVVSAEDDGSKVVLLSPHLGSIGIGSPIYYQGIHAGEVLGYELATDQKSVLIHGFVNAPFDDVLQGNTRFWNVSGIDLSMNADGFKVHTESIESLMYGGIAFETPASLQPIKTDISGLVFTLYKTHESIKEKSYTQKLQFVLFFDSSVRGLSLDAPVEFKGIKVGSVKDIRLEYDPADTSFRIPILVEIEPERIIAKGQVEDSSPYPFLKTLVAQGLRARLQTGSLLTGQLFVELVMRPETPVNGVDAELGIPQLPTIPADLEEITASVKRFLAKLDKVEIDQIAAELQGTLTGTNSLVNHPNWQSAVINLDASLASLKGVLTTVDKHADPLLIDTDKALVAARNTLEKAEQTMRLLDQTLTPDSQLHFRFIQMADEIAETARSIRVFVNLLERSPESMIFGKQPPRN